MVNTISAQDLKQKLDAKEDFILIDVLPKESYDARHVPGAVNVPLEGLGEWAEQNLPDKSKMVVVYCSSTTCQASPQAAKKLEALGYTNVVDFEAGLAGWQEAGFALEGEQTREAQEPAAQDGTPTDAQAQPDAEQKVKEGSEDATPVAQEERQEEDEEPKKEDPLEATPQ